MADKVASSEVVAIVSEVAATVSLSSTAPDPKGEETKVVEGEDKKQRPKRKTEDIVSNADEAEVEKRRKKEEDLKMEENFMKMMEKYKEEKRSFREKYKNVGDIDVDLAKAGNPEHVIKITIVPKVPEEKDEEKGEENKESKKGEAKEGSGEGKEGDGETKEGKDGENRVLDNIFPYGCYPRDGNGSCGEFISTLMDLIEGEPEGVGEEVRELEAMVKAEEDKGVKDKGEDAKDRGEDIKGKANSNRPDWKKILEERKADYEDAKKELKEASEIVDESVGRRVVYCVIDYPLSRTAVIKFELDCDVTFSDLLALHAKAYNIVYDYENGSSSTGEDQYIPGMFNRKTSDGFFGIWGHVIDDLIYNGSSTIEIRRDDVVCQFDVDS